MILYFVRAIICFLHFAIPMRIKICSSGYLYIAIKSATWSNDDKNCFFLQIKHSPKHLTKANMRFSILCSAKQSWLVHELCSRALLNKDPSKFDSLMKLNEFTRKPFKREMLSLKMVSFFCAIKKLRNSCNIIQMFSICYPKYVASFMIVSKWNLE